MVSQNNLTVGPVSVYPSCDCQNNGTCELITTALITVATSLLHTHLIPSPLSHPNTYRPLHVRVPRNGQELTVTSRPSIVLQTLAQDRTLNASA